MAKESSTIWGVLAAIGAGVGATALVGITLERTRLSPGWKAVIAGGANLSLTLTAIAVDAPNAAKGLAVATVLQSGMYAGQQVAALRYLGSPDSKQALPAPAGVAATIPASTTDTTTAASGTGTTTA